MKIIASSLGAFGLAIALAAPVQGATIVENGSFEQTAFGGSWRVFSDEIDGWDVTSGAGVEIQKNSVRGVLDTPFGNQYVELDSHNGNGGLRTGPSNSGIGQYVDLVAGMFDLTFYYSPRVNRQGTNGIDYSLSGLAGTVFSENVDGPSGDIQVGAWSQITKRFEIETAGSYLLTFQATGTDESLGGLMDNVSISQVPLPAGVVLLLSALGGLGFVRRRA